MSKQPVRVEELMNAVLSLGDGWQALDFTRKAERPDDLLPQHDFRRVAQAAARTFASEDGRLVLEWLLDLTLRRMAWHASFGVSVEQAYGAGVHREGQNSIAIALLSLIEAGGHEPKA